MKGKNCVAIASDKRFGIQAQTLSVNFEVILLQVTTFLKRRRIYSTRFFVFQKVFEMSPHLYVGLPGLATDIQTVHQRLKFRQNLYELKEGRRMSPKAFCAMLSNLLYERR